MSTLDEPLALFLNCFCQRIILLNLAQNWVELNVRDIVIFNRFWKQPPEWQVLYLSYWNSFFMFFNFFIESFAPNTKCCSYKSQKAGKVSRGSASYHPNSTQRKPPYRLYIQRTLLLSQCMLSDKQAKDTSIMSNFILKLLPAIPNHLQLEPGVAKRPRLSMARRAWAALLPLTRRAYHSAACPFRGFAKYFYR